MRFLGTGNSNGTFSIDPNTGLLSLAKVPNYAVQVSSAFFILNVDIFFPLQSTSSPQEYDDCSTLENSMLSHTQKITK